MYFILFHYPRLHVQRIEEVVCVYVTYLGHGVVVLAGLYLWQRQIVRRTLM